MDFNEYQKKASTTAIYPNIGNNFVYPTLGLVGESGEIAEKIKKIIRDKNGKLTNKSIKELEKEIGDVLWYLAQLATELKIPFEQIAKTNIKKLQSRSERKKIKGNGDNR